MTEQPLANGQNSVCVYVCVSVMHAWRHTDQCNLMHVFKCGLWPEDCGLCVCMQARIRAHISNEPEKQRKVWNMYICRAHRVELGHRIISSYFACFSFELIHICFHIKPLTPAVCLNLSFCWLGLLASSLA